MKVAFTAWEDRISPVFDSARRLLIADIENEQVIGRQYESFNPQPVSRLVDMLKALEIEVLICGAISRTPSIIIEGSGVKLISFVGGKIDDILKSYATGISIVPGFSMPGCGQQRKRRRRQHVFLKENEGMINMVKGDGKGPKGQGPRSGKGKGGCKTGRGGKGRGSSDQGCGQGQNQSRGQTEKKTVQQTE
jgi:predicted Fe-Mo cluster-binding NifX family protein